MSNPAGLLSHSRRARRAISRVEKKFATGESIECAMLAQRWLPFLQLALFLGALGDLLFLVVARPYYVAATSTQLYVFKAGRIYPSVGDRLFDSPLSQTRIEQVRGGPLRRVVKIHRLGGDEQMLAVHRAYWRELEGLQSLIHAATTA